MILDGSQGLRKAVRDTFGEAALVQRCQLPKLRNVLEHLPESQRPGVKASLLRAYQLDSVGAATRLLHDVARRLETAHPGAAASLREGLEDTLTLTRLRVSGGLRRTLCSTNPVGQQRCCSKRERASVVSEGIITCRS